MKHTHFYKKVLCCFTAGLLSLNLSAQPQKENKERVLQTMKQATEYMMNVVSYKGGFVWNYLPDFSRTWGEMEAKRTMVWIQPPGTPSVGHLLLDAYHATADEYYYESARKVASALIWGQLPCGGWNYMFDFAGENSLKQWYATIGRQGWRLEEFQHYYGNATFDDGGTIAAAKFLLRMYVEKNDPTFRPALDKVIQFVLESQYPIGGWPQRYPLKHDHPFEGRKDYSSFITLNDDVTAENIEFLVQCYQALGLQDVKSPIMRAINLMITLQQGAPYAGWADQYTVEDLQPAHARSYEPRSVNTGTTVHAIHLLTQYYQLTGETKFLSGIPAAIEFLESQVLPASEVAKFVRKPLGENDILVPRFIDPDKGTPLYVHREGSNIANGHYFINQDLNNTIAHYSSAARINTKSIRSMFEEVKKIPANKLTEGSPLKSQNLIPLPTYYTRRPQTTGDVNEVLKSFDKKGYWLTPLKSTSNPYKELPSEMTRSTESKYVSTMVGDEYDTSSYVPKEPVMGISTGVYIENMMKLILVLRK